MEINLQSVKQQLEKNSREALIELAFTGSIVPKVLKPQIMLLINTASNQAIQDICSKALEAIPFLENKDPSGLESFLTGLGVPQPFITMAVKNVQFGINQKQ